MKLSCALAFTICLTAPAAFGQSYQGITLGDPVPATRAPVDVQAFADRSDADLLPDYMRRLCKHQMLPTGATSLHAATNDCDGPVVLISASHALSSFFDPGHQDAPLTPEISGMVFHETTLADVRAKFCSEGLIAPRWYGQKDPDNTNAFAMAYQIAGTDGIVAFWFQIGSTSWMLSNDTPSYGPAERDAAVLISVDLMTSDFFALQTDAPAQPSAGYVPIQNILDPTTAPTTNCPLS